MANIQDKLNNIKNALFGKDVRNSIHDGIDAINKEVESTTNRQEHLETTFDQLTINAGNSNAEIVDARVGENGKSYAKLGDRLDSVDSQLEHNMNKINEQFNTKANKNEVREDTNIKPINVNEMDTETKILFTGGSVAVVGENAVGFENVKPKSLTLSKFRNYPVTGIPSKNLFDKNSIIKGFYVSYTSGTLTANKNYSVSDFIEVEEEQQYICNIIDQITFYNSNYQYVSGLNASREEIITIPLGVKYIRLNCANNDLDIYQLEKGTESTTYESFAPKLHESSIPTNVLDKINTPNYMIRTILEELANPFKPTNIKLLGDSITAGVGGTGYSATGDAIGTTGYNEPVYTSTSWANMLYNNIMTKYKREHYISPNDDNIKVTKKVGISTYPVIENFNLCKMHWRYKLHNLSTDKKGLKLRFYGDSIKVLYMKKNNTGIFEILIDGVSSGTVDTYIATGTTYSNIHEINGLSKDYHIIEIVETNTRNQSSTRNEFYIEGFIVNKHIEFKNYAISGKDNEYYYVNREQLISSNDDIVITQLGTNDRKTRCMEADAIIKSYLREIIKYGQSLGCKFILMCANPSTNESDRNFKMCDVNTTIGQLANEFNMPFISNYDWFIEYCNTKGIDLDTLLDDGLHPNDLGYKVMYENIARHLGLSIIS